MSAARNPAYDDQLQAAVGEARQMMNTALGVDATPARGVSPMFEECWQAARHFPHCPHLAATPAQPWLLSLPEPMWRCRRCTGRQAAARKAAGLTYGPVEEHTCDRCRRYSPPLTPLVMRQDLWTVIAAVCTECMEYATRNGARRKAA